MAKTNNIPTVKILLIFSWLIGSLGILGSGFLIVVGKGKINSLIGGVFVLLAAILISAIIRMLGNIGQMFFDYKAQLYTQTTILTQQLQAQTTILAQSMHDLKISFEQVGCDTKDINQNMNQIKTFFEQIERHLDLKK